MGILFSLLLAASTLSVLALVIMIKFGYHQKGTVFFVWFKKYFYLVSVLTVVSIIACFITGIIFHSSLPVLTAQQPVFK